jgi:biopolymer transport protein TolR
MAMSGMGGGGRGGRKTPMADINVTPLVDVMLVLLIIFMVTAPLMNAGVDVDLPKANAPAMEAPDKEALNLSIDKDLKFFIQETEFTPDELPPKLKAIAEANPEQVVFLRADGTVPYAQVAFVLAAAKNAGIPRVGMVFEPGVEDVP